MALARHIPTHRAEKANLQAAGRTRRGVDEPRFRTVPLFRANWIFILAKGQDSEPELDQITTNKFQVKEIRQSEALTECVASNVAAYATTRLAFQLKLLSGGHQLEAAFLWLASGPRPSSICGALATAVLVD
jgi:hypothetical protein